MNDLRQALRQLAKHPGFSLLVVLTLALGIGANTAIFSVVDAHLLRPLPYPHADRLVAVYDVQPGYGQAPASFEEWRDLSEHGRMFDAQAAYFATNANFADHEYPERVRIQLVSDRYFELVGLRPVAGRLFVAEEEHEAGLPAVVVNEWFWQARLGGRADAIGETVRLSDRPYTLVGVVRDPDQRAGAPTAAYLPLVPNAPWRDRGTHYLSILARVNAAITLDGARGDLGVLAARLGEEHGTTHTWAAVPLRDAIAGDARPLLLALFGAVGLILLIATANVANLFLMRAANRRPEFAVRRALGAGRSRLVRQLVAESLVLAGLGAIAGAALGALGTRMLVDLLAASVPGAAVRFDLRIFAFAGVIAVASVAVFGLAPAVLETRDNAARAIPAARRAREGLVVVELALALVLLVGAGLTIQSLGRLLAVDTGFDSDRLLTMSLVLPAARYPDAAQRLAFADDLTDRIAAVPGTRIVAVANHLPLSGSMDGDVEVEGRAYGAGEQPNAVKRVVSEHYFETLGVPLLRGRLFTSADRADSPPVVVVNETMARRLWPGENVVGQRIRSLTCGDCWEEVVGVVGDVRELAVHDAAPMQVYYPLRQAPLAAMRLVIRADIEAAALVGPVRRAVADVDALQPVYNVRTMHEIVTASVADRRLVTHLLTAFATLALLLAAVGVGGVISYAVAQRTREIGLRMALGAARAEVVRLVVGQGLRFTLLGLGVGIPVALVLARFLRSQLYEVAPGHPATYVVGAAVLGLVALAACYLPARRAARIDPMEALRHE